MVRALFALALSFTVALGACRSDRNAPSIEVSVSSPNNADGTTFQMEVVSTPQERKLGLMYRRELPEKQGMVFVFPDEKIQGFWMKNTLIPLDMVFVSKEGKVVGIVENAAPLTEEPRTVDVPSMYVLEFNAGVAKRYGISEGSTVRFLGPLPRGL